MSFLSSERQYIIVVRNVDCPLRLPGSNPSAATHYVCDLGQVLNSLCLSYPV